MKTFLSVATLFLSLGVPLSFETTAVSVVGFDRNQYPGDENLRCLRATFSYAGYWLNNPPGANANTWVGKRSKLEAAGFGFVVLFNGRLYRELGGAERERRIEWPFHAGKECPALASWPYKWG